MNIRITDLLDHYYDHSVSMLPPEEIFPELGDKQASSPEGVPRRRSFQKPLVVAATLLLILTGAFTLHLGFSRPEPLGGSLGEGDAYASTEVAASADEPGNVSEVTPVPTGTLEAPRPYTALVSSIIQGGELYFDGELIAPELSDLSGWTLEAVPAGLSGSDAKASAPLDYLTLTLNNTTPLSLDESGETLGFRFYGSGQLPEGLSEISFSLRLTNPDDPETAYVYPFPPMEYSGGNTYAHTAPRGFYHYDCASGSHISLQRVLVTSETITLQGEITELPSEVSESAQTTEDFQATVAGELSALFSQEDQVILTINERRAASPESREATAPEDFTIHLLGDGNGLSIQEYSITVRENGTAGLLIRGTLDTPIDPLSIVGFSINNPPQPEDAHVVSGGPDTLDAANAIPLPEGLTAALVLLSPDAEEEQIDTENFYPGESITIALDIEAPAREDEYQFALDYVILDAAGHQVFTSHADYAYPGSWTTHRHTADFPDLDLSPGTYTIEAYLNGNPVAEKAFSILEP